MSAVKTACEKCGSDLEMIADTPVGPVLHCTGCDRNIPAGAVKTLKLPGLDPGRQSVTVHEVEEPIMQRVRTVLEMAGYEVLCTVLRPKRQTCGSCGHNQWPSSGIGYGMSKGVPDLLARHPSWPRGLWLGIETKGTKTPLSPAQKGLAESGSIVVVRSEAEALMCLREAETELKR